MSFDFMPAKRERVSLLLGLAGASGSGKTKSALLIAEGMSPSGKICMIDTEARRGLHYADHHTFLHTDMRAPFRPKRFLEAVASAEDAGAEVIIIDSFSHEYDGEGGIKDWAEELAEGVPKPGIEHPRTKYSRDNDWWKDWNVKPVDQPGNWKEPKDGRDGHKRMMSKLLQCRASLIFCLRADEKIAIEKGEKGKTVVRPLGWMPICEKRFMFEMTASFTLRPDAPGIPQFDLPHKLQEQHRAMFPKGKHFGREAGRALAEWARGGEPVADAGRQSAGATASPDEPRITLEQEFEIRDMLLSRDIPEKTFLDSIKLPALGEIKAARFDAAKGRVVSMGAS